MDSAAPSWYDANRRYLMAALARVRGRLEGQVLGIPAEDPEALDSARGEEPPFALDALCRTFGLSPFERDVLLLCAGVELDSAFGAVCAAAQGDTRRAHPTFSLALATLPGAHWSALAPSAPLRRWRLIEVGVGDLLTQSPLRIDERILHYLAGVFHLDERLQGIVHAVPPPADLPPSLLALATRITALWSPAEADPPVLQLVGRDAVANRGVAAVACAALGLRLHVLRSADIPAAPAEREGLRRLWEREAALGGCALLVEGDDGEGGGARAFVSGQRSWVLTAGLEPVRGEDRSVLRLDVPSPAAAEQRELWRQMLGAAGLALNGQVDAVIAQFRLSLDGIRSASSQVLTTPSDAPDSGTALWDACRAQARPQLDGLAQRIEPVATREDLVLPPSQNLILREIAAHVRHRTKVYEAWGFAAKSGRGLGISAMFAGSSGTGKTMAAEVLARELRLDLYRIDLSQVVSKYIGETEKNLARVFDAAEEGGTVLLFDEADALFGKRSEVRDSHDRYANIEVSYLLQRMETYRGLAILTTNMRGALDTAFLRRLRFVVDFPFPDAAHREQIWRQIFPSDMPIEGLDFGTLARLNVAGGSIRNIALHAAFLAADEGRPVRMEHIGRAARVEYAKLEKPLTGVESGGWA